MFWDNLQTACKMRNVRITPILTELNVSTGNISKWQRGGNVSSETLAKLCTRLSVSADFLLFGPDCNKPAGSVLENRLTDDEASIIMMYRALPQTSKMLCNTYIRASYDQFMALSRELA